MTAISLRKMSQELGVSHNFLSQIRNGKRPMPATLRAKAEALGLLPNLLPTEHGRIALQAGGQGFDSPHLHHVFESVSFCPGRGSPERDTQGYAEKPIPTP
jgi:transcriptional regulator with XRE-family HTH domain